MNYTHIKNLYMYVFMHAYENVHATHTHTATHSIFCKYFLPKMSMIEKLYKTFLIFLNYIFLLNMYITTFTRLA